MSRKKTTTSPDQLTGTDAPATDAPAGGSAARTKKTGKGPSKAKTPKATSPAKECAPKDKKLSALDAAAKVLEEAAKPMNCQEMIAAMAEKGLWTSPAGKTPASTLYAAIAREIKIKGNQARFQKAARGQFAHQTPTAS